MDSKFAPKPAPKESPFWIRSGAAQMDQRAKSGLEIGTFPNSHTLHCVGGDQTGQELWKFQTGSGVVGSPVTWEQDGEQYVAVMSGWGGAVPLWGGEVAKSFKDINQGGSLWVFKLPK